MHLLLVWCIFFLFGKEAFVGWQLCTKVAYIVIIHDGLKRWYNVEGLFNIIFFCWLYSMGIRMNCSGSIRYNSYKVPYLAWS